MAELTPLSILITADADDLKAELSAARAALNKFDTAASKGAKGSTALGGAMNRLGNVSGSTRAKIQMTSYQLQDIAVQMQMGTRASTVMAQQLPQLASAFGPVGAIVGTLAAVGIPALAFAFGSAEEEANTLGDAMSDLETSMSDLSAVSGIANGSLEELRKKYGENAEAVRALFRELVAVNQQQALNSMQASVIAAKDEIAGMTTALNDFSKARRTLLEAKDQIDLGLGPLPSELKAMEDAVAAAAETLSEKFGVTSAQAYRIVDAMNAVEEAAGPDQAALAASQLASAISSAVAEGASLDAVMSAVASSSAQAYAAFSQAMTEGQKYKEQISNLATAGVGLGIDWTPETPALDGGAGGGGGVRRGGGGGGARSNPLESQLEALQNSLMSQEEAQIASFERQQETLQQALEQKLLTLEEYNSAMEAAQQQHGDKMAAIDAYRYGDGLQATGAFLGDMANALSQGNEQMLRISKAFGAAEALVNAWRAASQALSDPSIPFWGKFAAMAQVLAAGMGAVDAIKSVGKGGTGRRGGGGRGEGNTIQGQGEAGPSVSRSLTLIGDNFNRKQAVQIAEFLNEGSDNGLVVRGR